MRRRAALISRAQPAPRAQQRHSRGMPGGSATRARASSARLPASSRTTSDRGSSRARRHDALAVSEQHTRVRSQNSSNSSASIAARAKSMNHRGSRTPRCSSSCSSSSSASSTSSERDRPSSSKHATPPAGTITIFGSDGGEARREAFLVGRRQDAVEALLLENDLVELLLVLAADDSQILAEALLGARDHIVSYRSLQPCADPLGHVVLERHRDHPFEVLRWNVSSAAAARRSPSSENRRPFHAFSCRVERAVSGSNCAFRPTGSAHGIGSGRRS